MTMPLFSTGDDPGANFAELLRRVGLDDDLSGAIGRNAHVGTPGDALHDLGVPHATTCVALNYGEGVVMAGDRRATSGNLISHRRMEKVVEA